MGIRLNVGTFGVRVRCDKARFLGSFGVLVSDMLQFFASILKNHSIGSTLIVPFFELILVAVSLPF